MPSEFTLRYVNARAWAEPIRFLFAYKGIEYEDVRVTGHDLWNESLPPDMLWTNHAEPILEFDGKRLYQYNVILRFLGHKFGMAGEDAYEAAKCDETVEALHELRQVTHKCWAEKDAGLKAVLREGIQKESFPKYFKVWNETLGRNGGFLVGSALTYADFSIASRLQIYQEVYGQDILDAFPQLKHHLQAVFNAPGIKEWVASRPLTEY